MTIQLRRSCSSSASSYMGKPSNFDKYDVSAHANNNSNASRGRASCDHEEALPFQQRRSRSHSSYHQDNNQHSSPSAVWQASRSHPLLDSYVQRQQQAWFATNATSQLRPQFPSRRSKSKDVEEQSRGSRRARLLLNCFTNHSHQCDDDQYFAPSMITSKTIEEEGDAYHGTASFPRSSSYSKRHHQKQEEKSATGSEQRRFHDSFDQLDSVMSGVTGFEELWKEGLHSKQHVDASLVDATVISTTSSSSHPREVDITMTSLNIIDADDDNGDNENNERGRSKTVSWKPKLAKLFRPRRRRAKSLDGERSNKAAVEPDSNGDDDDDDDLRAWQVSDPPVFEASPTVVVSTGDRDDSLDPLKTEAVECEYRPDFTLQEKLESELSWVDVPVAEEKKQSESNTLQQQKALNVIELGQYASSINNDSKNVPVAKKGWFEKRKMKGFATIHDHDNVSPNAAKLGWGKNLGSFFDKDHIPAVGRSQSSLSSSGSVLAVSYGKESCAQLVIQQDEVEDHISHQSTTGSTATPGILRNADNVSYSYSQANNSIIDKSKQTSVAAGQPDVIPECNGEFVRKQPSMSTVGTRSDEDDEASDSSGKGSEGGSSNSDDEETRLLFLEEFSILTSEVKANNNEPQTLSESGAGSRLGAAYAHPAAELKTMMKHRDEAERTAGPIDLDTVDDKDDKEVDDFVSQLSAKKLRAPARLVPMSSTISSHASSALQSRQHQQERKEVMGNVTYHHFQTSTPSVARQSSSAASQTPSRRAPASQPPPSSCSANSAKFSNSSPDRMPPTSVASRRAPMMDIPVYTESANLNKENEHIRDARGTKHREMKRDEQAKVWNQVPLQKQLWSDLSNPPPPVAVPRTKTLDQPDSYLNCIPAGTFPKTRTTSSAWTRDFSESSWRGGNPGRADSFMTRSFSNLTTSTFGDEDDDDILDTLYKPIDKLAQRLEQKMCTQLHEDPRLAAVVARQCGPRVAEKCGRGAPTAVPTVPFDEQQIDFRLKRHPKKRPSQRRNNDDFPDPL